MFLYADRVSEHKLSTIEIEGANGVCGTWDLDTFYSVTTIVQVMAVLQEWRTWFWDADFWLPENSTWQTLEEAKNLSWGQSGELFLCFPVAFALIILRFLFER